MERVTDVLVVGGGPAGSATAVHARHAGLDVLVVDRARFPRDKPCAEYLSPEATRDLDELGVTSAIEAAGAQRLHGFRLVSDDGQAATGRFGPGSGYVPYRDYGYALPRTVLDPILLDAAREAGAEVWEAAALERLVLSGGRVAGGVVRTPAGPVNVRAAAVVGADGLNSLVARQLGVARRGRLARLALVAHLDRVADLGDVGEMFAGAGRYLGLAALGGGRANAAAVIPVAEARRPGFDAEAALWAELRRWPELARRTMNSRIVRRVLVAGPFARRSRRPTADGALLVGDAAEFYDPFTGEGIFAALRGGRLAAEVLCAALGRSGGASRRNLRAYVRARGRAFTSKWILERVAGHGATAPWLMRRVTRALARQRDLADLWVAAAGDIAPARALFTPTRLAALLA